MQWLVTQQQLVCQFRVFSRWPLNSNDADSEDDEQEADADAKALSHPIQL